MASDRSSYNNKYLVSGLIYQIFRYLGAAINVLEGGGSGAVSWFRLPEGFSLGFRIVTPLMFTLHHITEVAEI